MTFFPAGWQLQISSIPDLRRLDKAYSQTVQSDSEIFLYQLHEFSHAKSSFELVGLNRIVNNLYQVDKDPLVKERIWSSYSLRMVAMPSKNASNNVCCAPYDPDARLTKFTYLDCTTFTKTRAAEHWILTTWNFINQKEGQQTYFCNVRQVTSSISLESETPVWKVVLYQRQDVMLKRSESRSSSLALWRLSGRGFRHHRSQLIICLEIWITHRIRSSAVDRKYGP